MVLDQLYLFSKVARSRRTGGRVQGAVLRTDTSSIRPRFIPDFSNRGNIRTPRGRILVGDASKKDCVLCFENTAVSRVIWMRFQVGNVI